MKDVYKLRDTQGTSAVVYTQIVDVEQESNGLLTCDRAILKPDAGIITAANQGKFLPLPPNPNPELVPTSDDEPQTWSYTTDKPADDWFQPAFNVSTWKSGPAVFGHDISGMHTPWTTSDIWIRRDFLLPTSLPEKLYFFVKHDEDAEIYVNGTLAATVPGYTGDCASVPLSTAGRAALKLGRNILAVHCHQTAGGQGIDVGIISAN